MTTLTKKISDWAIRLAGARSAVADLHAADADIRAAIATLSTERETLVRARPDKASVRSAIHRQVDGTAEAWAREHGPRLITVAGRLKMAPTGEVAGVVPGDLAALFAAPLDFATLCALQPEAVKQRLTAIVEATAYVAGPALDERPALIAELDARRRELEAQHRALVDEAAAAPLRDLADVAAARLREPREREKIDRFNEANQRAIARGAVREATTIEQAR